MKDVARRQAEIQFCRDQLKSIESTIATVYGEQKEAVLADATPASVRPESISPKRRVSREEYERIIVPFMRIKEIARHKEIRDHVSHALGFPATADMIKRAMDSLLADPRIPLVRMGRGLIGYKRNAITMTPERQPQLSAVAI